MWLYDKIIFADEKTQILLSSTTGKIYEFWKIFPDSWTFVTACYWGDACPVDF